MSNDLITTLQDRLRHPLPGVEAQYRMAHAVRRTADPPPADARLAGVLALFYPKNEVWHLVLIERQSFHEQDRHKGQISFPGGRFEDADGHLLRTALRETEEEIGVRADQVQVLGGLTQLYIPVSNFLVNPFVGLLRHTPVFHPDPREVKAILEVPFDLLRDPLSIQSTDLKITEHITLKDVPYFNVAGKIVWGATAMMLSELLHITGDFPPLGRDAKFRVST